MPMRQTILVPTDFSALSRNAALFARDLAHKLGADLPLCMHIAPLIRHSSRRKQMKEMKRGLPGRPRKEWTIS